MFVYVLFNTRNMKAYVGQHRGERLRDRWNEDLSGGNPHLNNAVKKYGSQAFTRTILYRAKTQLELDRMETFFIVLYQSFNPEFGYNKTMGGGGGAVTEEVKVKLRSIKRSDEFKRKISQVTKGRKKSIEGRINSAKKLTELDVKKIRKLYVEGKRQTEIAKLFNLHPDTVRMVVRRWTWDWVAPEIPLENRLQSVNYRNNLSESAKLFWTKMTPEERKIEGQRRYAKARDNKLNGSN